MAPSVRSGARIDTIALDAKLEGEIAELDEGDWRGPRRPRHRRTALEEVSLAAYAALDLIRSSRRARRIAGLDDPPRPERRGGGRQIDTDLARGFIRAEVIEWDKLAEAGGETEAKRRGWVRVEAATTSSRTAMTGTCASTSERRGRTSRQRNDPPPARWTQFAPIRNDMQRLQGGPPTARGVKPRSRTRPSVQERRLSGTDWTSPHPACRPAPARRSPSSRAGRYRPRTPPRQLLHAGQASNVTAQEAAPPVVTSSSSMFTFVQSRVLHNPSRDAALKEHNTNKSAA